MLCFVALSCAALEYIMLNVNTTDTTVTRCTTPLCVQEVPALCMCQGTSYPKLFHAFLSLSRQTADYITVISSYASTPPICLYGVAHN